ncbi:UNVERIFIED_CONTAM: hypothetical protein Slati_3646800 [Sesamum latifolium]|uniref:Endonuclease/exonuclease/phosphatase domain-containing protein n=1 Tax=Sesamum latifolium TaxID=2727402 RepID=A0AAW2TZX0_9LAMI
MDKKGGLMLLWRKDINLVVNSFSCSHIDVGVFNKEGVAGWRFTGIYGQPDVGRRGETWQLLRRLSGLLNQPWLCAGDFNEILTPDEKIGAPRPRKQMDNFRACLSDCQLYDLGYVGNKFTWCNRREAPATVRVRLDRACATTDWRHRFPNSRVVTDVARGSDHSPLIIHLEADPQRQSQRRRKIFRFEAMWTRDDGCEELIRSLWNSGPSESAGQRVLQNLAKTKAGLISWDKSHFGHVRRRVKELEERLIELDKEPITCFTRQRQEFMRRELEELLSREDFIEAAWKDAMAPGG